ncbi:MAG TPA: LPS export ABC transporter periplasmic protein LptC [Planctomycetota bacterium]|nr:LPS export ABC transporter periplasmic protein LptC [Planctomycetota bacterium]HRR82873.1 LPS export ABC transporter periplasmic protein LptC [Planctomycetota bacterium]HRT97545.1 LPS export ABC transporter periplasmic protein LptC [Planctomycetota bacterium]
MAKRHCGLLFLAVAAAGALQGGEGPKEPAPKVKVPVAETRGFELPFYNDATGELQWKVLAGKVTGDPNNPRLLHGTDVRIIAYRNGIAQTATGKKGVVNTETRAATLEGDVVIELNDEQPTKVETDDLDWDSQHGTASTRGPVKIRRVDLAVTGLGMRLWLTTVRAENAPTERTGQVIIERRVRAELVPNSNTSLLQAPTGGQGEPVVVTCDGSLHVSRSELTAVFRDNVRATQGKQALTCDLLTVKVQSVPGEKGKAELERVVASGSVRLDDAHTVALADAAEWRREEGSLRLVGRPAEIRWDNGNRLAAGLIHRMGDGAEIVCASTPEYRSDVYLLAATIERAMPGEERKATSALRVEDISDWPAFCAAVAERGAAKAASPAKRLWELLPAETRAILDGAARGNTLGQQRKAEVVAALNGVLKARSLHREASFKDLPLPPEAGALLQRAPEALSAAEAQWLNRRILEACFPGLIARTPQQRPPARPEPAARTP